jgi:hypothetical protein
MKMKTITFWRPKNLSFAIAMISLLFVFVPSQARAVADGPVNCGTSGTFTIASNVVTARTNCVGSVTIPEGVTSVANDVFYGASAVTSVSLPSTLLTIGSSAFRTTSITSIQIPSSVTSIGALAFSINAVNVTSATFASPSSLTTIGDYAFQYSDFSSITIPASVTSMGTDVFNANNVLTEIYFLGNKPGGSTSDIHRKASITVFKTSTATGFSSTWLGATVVSPPEAPTSLSATAGDAQISIAFTAGANNGGALTNYKYSLDGTTYTAFSPSDTTTPVVVTGLTNGTSYTIRLKAVNAAGDSAASASVTATPIAVPNLNAATMFTGQSLTVTGTGFNSTVTLVLQGNRELPSFFSQQLTISTFTINSDTSLTFIVPPASSFLAGATDADWTIQARNTSSEWNNTGTSTLQIYLPSPAFSLSASSLNGPVGTSITSYAITSTGGTIASYSISPAISNTPGLSFSTTTGLISGTPTTAAVARTYTITATNATSSASQNFSITITGSTQENVDTGPPPSFLIVKTSPTISLTLNTYTCSAGVLIFWRYSTTEEPSKLSYQKISLLRNGEAVASTETLKSLATFEKNSAWAGSTMTCQVIANQEHTTGIFTSLNSDKYNELAKAQGAAIKAADTKYFSDRTAAYENKRIEQRRISDARAKDLSTATTTTQARAAAAKYRAGLTQASKTWKSEIDAAIQRRASSKAEAPKAFTQGLEKFGLALLQP